MASLASEASSSTSTWRSCKKRRVGWSGDACKVLAEKIVGMLPAATQEKIKSGQWKGGRLIQPIADTPTMAQCEKNYIFIKPVLRAYPMKTPSPYMIADAMLIADGLLAGNLLKIPGVDEAGLQDKTSMAVMEWRRTTSRS